ncbi:MAG TPA: hypothetical protein VI456_15500 [Polyangia bacterium]
MPSNRDFKDLFSALSAGDVRFLVVGAHAVMLYTAPRYTKDLDIWVEPTRKNAERVHAALIVFGAPMSDLTVEDLAEAGTIFQMGVEPNRIDVVTSIDGVEFGSAWDRSTRSTYDGVPIRLLGIADLLANKRLVNRDQDRIDVARLEAELRRKP